MWGRIKWIVTLLFSAVLAMTAVPRDDAFSNFSSYFKSSPEWVKSPAFDPLFGFIIIFCIILLFSQKIITFLKPLRKAIIGMVKSVDAQSGMKTADTVSPLISKNRAIFDYSTNNGNLTLGEGEKEFQIHFSKASNKSIHIYKTSSCFNIARVKNANRGDILCFDKYDSSSRCYTINVGEHFLAKNPNGYVLQGKIIAIKDDSRGDDHDEVVFDYRINKSKYNDFKAL